MAVDMVERMHGNSPLLRLPDEILLAILHAIPAQALAKFQQASRKCRSIGSDQLLWKAHCHTHFRYWHPKHGLGLISRERTSDFDWKTQFIYRTKVNLVIKKRFELIVNNRQPATSDIIAICQHEEDAKDFFVRLLQATDYEDKPTFRRWLVTHILFAIHRRIAFRTWASTIDEDPDEWPAYGYKPKRLERLLSGFDMFCVVGEEYDLDSNSSKLDSMADAFCLQNPDYMRLNVEDRAICLLRWLSDLNVTEPMQYTDPFTKQQVPCAHMSQCLFGVLQRENRRAMAAHIRTVVYVALAQRLDIPAYFSTSGDDVIITRLHTDSPLYVAPKSNGNNSLVVRPALTDKVVRDHWFTQITPTDIFVDDIEQARRILSTLITLEDPTINPVLEVCHWCKRDHYHMNTRSYMIHCALLFLCEVAHPCWDSSLTLLIGVLPGTLEDVWQLEEHLMDKITMATIHPSVKIDFYGQLRVLRNPLDGEVTMTLPSDCTTWL